MADTDGDIKLTAVLDELEFGGPRARGERLKDLKAIFDPRNSANIGALDDDRTWHKIFEVIFQVAITEKHSFLSVKASSKTAASKNLAACGEVLRVVAKAGARKLGSKTIGAIVDHISQTLPNVNGEYCEPLQRNYPKAFDAIFEQPSNVEGLKRNTWIDAVKFCLLGINQYMDQSHPEPSSFRNSSGQGRSLASRPFVRSASSTSTNSDHSSPPSKENAEDLLQALHSLVSATNAPISDCFGVLTDGVLRFWRSQGSRVSQTHQLIFSIINIVISYTRTDQISFSKSTAKAVLPIISQFWQGKAVAKDEMLNSIRDEMLVFLISIYPYLERLVKDNEDQEILPLLEELSEVLKADYVRRSVKDQLQLDDLDMLDFGSEPSNANPFQLDAFQLRLHNIRGERNWAHLQMIGIMERLVNVKKQNEDSSFKENNEEQDEHSNKRRRTTRSSDRILEPLKSEDEKIRLVGLQVLPFILVRHQLQKPELEQTLDALQTCASDKRGSIASWALLAIASCTFQKLSPEIGSSLWASLWHLGIRTLTFSNTCRAAALQLHAILARNLVQYRDICEDASAIITSADVSGPVVLCDSAIFLMTHLLHMRIAEVPSAVIMTTQYTVRWLFARWNPAEKSFAAHFAVHVLPHHIINLLRVSLGLHQLPFAPCSIIPIGILAQAWQQHLNSSDVVGYLLLLDPLAVSTTRRCSSCPIYTKSGQVTFVLDTANFTSTRRLILELFLPKCNDLFQSWKSYTEDRVAPVSPDTFRNAVYTCLTMLLAVPFFSQPGLPQFKEFESSLEELSKDLVGSLGGADVKDPTGTRILTETLLQSVQQYLPFCKPSEFAQLFSKTPHLSKFFVAVAEVLKKHRFLLGSMPSDADIDLMEIDDDFDNFSAQQSHDRPDKQKLMLPRRLLTLDSSPKAFDFSVRARLLLLSDMSITPEETDFVPTIFFDHLVTMSDQEILLAHSFIKEFVNSDLTIDVGDATRLVERTAELLGSDDFGTSEILSALILDILIGLGHFWCTADLDSKLGLYALDLYKWFISKALKTMAISAVVQKRIATLLLYLLETDSNYGEPALPSARSSLFNLLKQSDASVKLYIGTQLPNIFHMFLLDNHDDVFVDILQNLPSDPGWMEGMLLRMFILSRIASRLSTLLRRCIYHIFEVPAKLQGCLEHAAKCLSDISSAVNLTSVRELFGLFAPQLLYTWLHSGDGGIEDIPFQIFGYPSMRNLISDAQEDVVGIVMMLGQDEAVRELAEILGENEIVLLETCFTKIIAYTIAYEIAVSRPSSTNKHATGQARIKKRLGSDRFYQRLNHNFSEIIALLFTLSEPQDKLDHSFEKEGFKEAASIMTEIKNLTPTRIGLPSLLQPSFLARHLPKQVKHISARIESAVDGGLYTPALVVFIARKLSSTIHPSLGSLHACSVLRKLRTLICLAGESATTGYPLEMLLRMFRPFINDPQCVNDAIGITQYLLTRGSAYLKLVPSFLAGIALSILGSLRSFLKAGRASSTQEMQHKSTISRVQKFHKWFGEYLTSYRYKAPSGQSSTTFAALVKSACVTNWVGNADLGTAESDLLVQILRDERMDSKLLSRPSRELALKMLCSEFKPPGSFRTDVLGEDRFAVESAVAVWKSCRGESHSANYLAWAGRVLGRAFVASGHIDLELLRESALAQIKDLSPLGEDERNSQFCIISILQELTLGYDEHNVGLAEASLRIVLATTDDLLIQTAQHCLTDGLYRASQWAPYQTPPSDIHGIDERSVHDPYAEKDISRDHWLRDLSIELSRSVSDNTLLQALIPVLRNVNGFAERAFPFILHLVLSTQLALREQTTQNQLSSSFESWFGHSHDTDKNNLKVLINAILYLRTQPMPNENSSADRLYWLNFDYMKAATAATYCGMHKTALLFVEEHHSAPVKLNRRSSVKETLESAEVPNDILLTIFQNIDDPDMYYGVQQKATLRAILDRFEYEKDGPKSLAFRGAQFDSHIRRRDAQSDQDAHSLVKALDVLSLSGLSHSLLQAQQSVGMSATSIESMFRTSRKLEQWDLPVPSVCSNNAVAIYKAFQTVHTATDYTTIQQAINEGFNYTMNNLMHEDLGASDLHGALQTLAALVEMDEVYSTKGSEDIEQILSRFDDRSDWMKIGRFDDISQILSCRGTTLSTLSQQPRLRSLMNVELIDTRLVEVRASLLSSSLNRAHSALQESLSLATSMMDLIEPCRKLSLNLEVAIHMEAANALWDQGETISSIGILQALDNPLVLKKQSVPIGRSELLSKTGHQVSIARLEKADKIIEKYLRPALKDLKGKTGSKSGQVFHQFAIFCDQQLEDPDSLEDLERLKKLSKGKRDELEQLDKFLKAAATPNERNKYRNLHTKARTWYRLDEEELQRHISSREEFLRQSLENYLLALAASDDHNAVALRFTALWLEHAETLLANDSVAKHLAEVPSRKFAPLMNQLTSRLQDSPVKFQKLLFSLVLRICTDHPYHGMYQIYAGTSTNPNSNDEAAIARKDAAKKIGAELSNHPKVSHVWAALNFVNKNYGYLAGEKDESRYKAGRKVALKDSKAGTLLNNQLAKYRVPSPTLHIPLAADLNYSNIPFMQKLEPSMSIASGVSTPKIITAIADNGQRFKQLVKGGNDDLRQDAIMEQVFEQVSELLKSNRTTRQRDLKIRTYKVLPLTSTAGVIEFVPNTIPLHEYLLPAHERYHPRDMKGNTCRTEIGSVQTQSVETRVKKFRHVTERFRPVMRYFFTERFTDPDEWFVKRNAYTRSTAAISILGHVLGLGDRHGHNILLDSESGEAVHIDLGVAFEMGRVLPVPELVPFRLTRDIVDGMGITKTEGVFRRCCEFTLEALRKEAYSIMTILDVLRYDPLYSWSISPVRLAKLQEGQSAVLAGDERVKEAVNEPGEADRALTVVNKKLSKTLSVQATVNDLINQASDERNLAVLYSGWAAYA